MYVPVGALLIITVAALGIGVFLRIVEVEVAGASRYTRDDIVLASGISPGDNMLFLDTDAAVRRIRMALPYISEVKIEYALPATVKIMIKESVGVAVIEYQTKALLIDSSGRVLGLAGTVRDGLVEILGFYPVEAEVGGRLRVAPDSETQLGSLIEVITAFEKAGFLDSVSYLDVTHIAAIRFRYIDRFTVTFGDSGEADYKLSLLLGMVEKIDEEKSVNATGRIDISDPSGESRFIEDW